MKHTATPWIIDEVNTANGVSYFIDHVFEEDNNGEVHTDQIAEVIMDYSDPAIPLGNARLMAASPAMYSALSAIIAEHDRLERTGDCLTDFGQLLKAARESMAEAEGKQS